MPLKKLLCVLFLFVQLSFVNGQKQSYRFRHITYSQGLTNSSIYSINQDEFGFIWLGTEGGVFRYDGFRFKVYKTSMNQTGALNSNFVYSICHDSRNNLWVGTYKDLMLYDRLNDNFIDFHLSEKFTDGEAIDVQDIYEVDSFGIAIACNNAGAIVINPGTRSVDSIKTRQIREVLRVKRVMKYHYDNENNLWIGTLSGLYKWNLITNEKKYYDLSVYSGRRESNYVVGLYEDSFSNIWIATRGGGVLQKPAGTEKFKVYLSQLDNPKSIGSNECYEFWQEAEGDLWISTNGTGINVYHYNTDQFSRLSSRQNDNFSLLNNNTRAMFEDRQGNLWISSFQAGVNILVNTPYQFQLQSFESLNENGFQSTSVISFFQENENIVWVGTDGGGLKRVNRKKGNVLTFQPGSAHQEFPDRVVMNIYRDYKGYLWMGTYLEGLIRFNPETYNYVQFKNEPDNPQSLSNNFVTTVLEDTRGNLWVGTNGGGLNLFDDKKQTFMRFTTNNAQKENTVISDFVNVIEEDYNGDLWIGTYWGLSKLDIRNFTFKHYLAKDAKNLNSNVIYSLLSDSQDRLWVGTRMGLHQFDFKTGTFINYPQPEEVSDYLINGILEDDKGDLWLSTDNGMIQFNPEENTIHRFSLEDGLQGNEFYHNSYHKGVNGELFFGGYNGYNSFMPDSIKQRSYFPDVIITNLNILNNDIPIGEIAGRDPILEKNIMLTEQVKLKHFDKSISFSFSAIDFIEGNKNLYAYKLDGFDQNWNYTTTEYPFANYTNLSPGEYVLRVKSGKTEFIHENNNETKISIVITPPVWQTWYAYLLYVSLIIFLFFYFWRQTIRRVEERNEVSLEKLKREQTEELSQSRARFFTNISHEIRTPLTLIIGPLENMLAVGKELQPYRKQLDVMLKNARRLLRLINQLLDLRKFELQKMSLKAEYADVVTFIKDIVYSFEELATDKKIDFQFKPDAENVKMWFDPDKMDKILFNLLSNAFKYTGERKNITVALKSGVSYKNATNKFIELSVSDTGKGIKAEELSRIFNRFYQGDQQGADNQGWGLGLSLTYAFVEIHHGFIEVESERGKGTHFKLYFPLGENHLAKEEMRENVNEPGINKYLHISSAPYIEQQTENSADNKKVFERQYQVLIVEDNRDLREYLMTELDTYFQCFDAPDGKEGLEMAIDLMPDLIISDIMMPGLNGLELLKAIKENIITSHIPVVLLTAKNALADQIEGFETGADAYVSKPFNIVKLRSQLESILENRKKIRDKLNAFSGVTKAPKPKSADDKFLQLVDEKINENLSNNYFGVEELSREIEMSRAHLHRKLKALIKIGPNEYIRKIKMEKAAEILLKGELSITQVSAELGFNSTSYFSSTFKSFYKVSPKTFIDMQKSGI